MKIAKNRLFLGLLTVGLILNVIVLVNFQLFFVRSIFSFVFLTTIPGYLILFILKFKTKEFWEHFVYSVGLSVAFIMFAGLSINLILPWLHMTNKPLTLTPLLICFDVLLTIIGFIAFKTKENITLKIKFPKVDVFNKILFITPVILPIISVLGAITLNNGGSNFLALMNYVMICILVILVFVYQHRVHKQIYPFIILMISISFLLSGWLRSNYISGSDLNQEFQIFQISKINQIWRFSDYKNIYNSCLSLNILPTILSLMLNINDQYVFKLFIPIIFSITPVIIYLISKKYLTESLAFLSAFFFMSQPTFTTWAYIPIRQEVAFIFFSLSILVLISKTMDTKVRNIIFLSLNFAMIVSHYSTVYIALAIYVSTYIFHKVVTLIHPKIKPFYLSKTLSFKKIVILFAFTYLWYSQITFGLNYFTDFMNNGLKNVSNIFTNNVQAQGQSIFDQINIFHKQNVGSEILNKYVYEASQLYNQSDLGNRFYKSGASLKYQTMIFAVSGIPYKMGDNIFYYSLLIRSAIKLFGVLFVILGILYYSLTKSMRHKGDLFLNLVSFVILLFATVTPFISINYDLGRTYQQLLYVLSFAAILGSVTILNKFKIIRSSNILIVFFILYLLFLSRFTQQFIGGSDISMVFNNMGTQYSMLYTHKTEISSGQWLSNNYSSIDFIFADNYANKKIRLTSLFKYRDSIKLDVLPTTITKDSYVYLSYANVIDGVTYKSYRGNTLTYNYPNQFLVDNKNLIYNNGGSEIFK